MADAHKIAVIGGDGTGPEVAAEGVKVLQGRRQARRLQVRAHRPRLGRRPLSQDRRSAARRRPRPAPQVRRHPPRRRRPSRRAAGHPRTKLLLDLRFGLDQYINLRPVKLFPGVESPLKDKRPGGHRLHRRPREHRRPVLRRRRLHAQGHAARSRHADGHLHPQAAASAAIRYAFELTRKRNNPKGKKLTLVAKTNVLTYRPRPVVADVPGSRPTNIPTSRPTTTTSTPAACGW